MKGTESSLTVTYVVTRGAQRKLGLLSVRAGNAPCYEQRRDSNSMTFIQSGTWRGEKKGQDKCKVVLRLRVARTGNPDGNWTTGCGSVPWTPSVQALRPLPFLSILGDSTLGIMWLEREADVICQSTTEIKNM